MRPFQAPRILTGWVRMVIYLERNGASLLRSPIKLGAGVHLGSHVPRVGDLHLHCGCGEFDSHRVHQIYDISPSGLLDQSPGEMGWGKALS